LNFIIPDVAKLPPLAGEMEEEEREEKPTVVDRSDSSPSPASTPMKKKRETANPKIPNPYGDESNMLLPIFVSVAAFVPLLFCLCKL